MGVSVLLLLLLDWIIVSPSPGTTRLVIAAALSAIVLVTIGAIWRRNSGLEKLAPGKPSQAR